MGDYEMRKFGSFRDDADDVDPALKKRYRNGGGGRRRNGKSLRQKKMDAEDIAELELEDKAHVAQHREMVEEELNNRRRIWKNAMVLNFNEFCCQEFVTDEEIIFSSHCAMIARVIWFVIIIYLFMYMYFIARGYRVMLHRISAPIVSVNSDYAYFADSNDLNAETFWDGNTQPDPAWCFNSEFYAPNSLEASLNYITSPDAGMVRMAPFSTISACLNPMKSAEFVSSTQSPNIQIPTSIVTMDTNRTSKYDTNAFSEAQYSGSTGAHLFQNHSRAYFLTGVDFATVSIDFFADNWEEETSTVASYDGWSPSFEVMLLNANAAIVRGCPNYPDSGSNTYYTGVSSSDFTDGDDCIWAPATSNGGRITMNLHNILSAAELNLNDDNAMWKSAIDEFVSGVTNYNDLDGDAAEYPYRLSGVTLLMNIEISNACAGPKTFFEADSTYDVMNHFQSDCLLSSLPAFSTPVIHANITVSKIAESSTIESLLVQQSVGSATFEVQKGVTVVVQVTGDLYTENSYRTMHVMYQLILLLAIFNLGLFLINSFVTSPLCCQCVRTTNCCESEQEVLFWASIKEETGFDIDPVGLRFWDMENQVIDKMSNRNASDNHLFRKLNSEPIWVTRQRVGKRTVWKDYGYREVEGDLNDVKDAISYYDELRSDHAALFAADVSSGKLEGAEDWLGAPRSVYSKGARDDTFGKAKMDDAEELHVEMNRRLEAKIEGLKLLLADPTEGQNLLRLTILEAFDALRPIIKRKLRVKALQAKTAFEAHKTYAEKGGNNTASKLKRAFV